MHEAHSSNPPLCTKVFDHKSVLRVDRKNKCTNTLDLKKQKIVTFFIKQNILKCSRIFFMNFIPEFLMAEIKDT